MFDLQSALDNATRAMRAERLKGSPQLLLGELILKLEAIDSGELPVYYDFGNNHPTSLCSWRGSYDELALDFDTGDASLTVDGLLTELRGAIGKTYTGYKGGDYVMGKATPVWADEYGIGNDKGIVDVQREEEKVILVTKTCEF